MEASLGRSVCGGELYAAHFLGADSACKLIRTKDSAPAASAAQLFPQAAAANRNVFFHADGSAKTVREVYDWAIKQPSGAKTVEAKDPKPAASSKNYVQYGALSTGVSDQWTAFQMLNSMGGNSFSTGTPSAPFALTSSVIDMLAQLSPSGDAQHTH